jgi:RimJ/RimL family protein N-acetyltransferase
LTLRPFKEGDSALLLSLDSDPAVMKFISDGRPSTLEEVEAVIPRVLGYYEKYDHQLGVWAAIENSTGAFAGWFHLRPDKDDLENVKDLELGYRLKAAFWGKGLATEMSKLLLEKSFRELNADTVFATAMKENRASIHIMEKLGMKFQLSFIQNKFPGADKSALRYQILKTEWKAL